MEGYTVLARRYRPQTFDEIVGQEHVARTLKNALKEGRVAHAYLFAGPRGVGKTTMARILAKALNCEKGTGPQPCLQCDACTKIHAGHDHDVVEIDAASNRNVEDARLLRESAKYTPLRSPHKVYIIDEAHMLTRDAFNTLLKVLEEPPAHVKFIFATTEVHKLLDTIVSRCQRFDFGRITQDHLTTRLKQICEREKLSIDDEVLRKIAGVARGGMRDAESLLEQLVAFRNDKVTIEDVNLMVGAASDEAMLGLFEAVREGATDAVFARLHDIFIKGADPTAFTDQSIETLRALLIVQSCGREQKILELTESTAESLDALQKSFSKEALLYMMQLLLEARRRLREGLNPQIVLELTFAKLASISDLVTLGDAIQAIRSGNVQAAPAPKPQPSKPARLQETAPRSPKPTAPEAKETQTLPNMPPADAGLTQKWDALITAIHDSASVLDRTVLRECSPEKLDGRMLSLAVPPNLHSAMHRRIFERLQKKDPVLSPAIEQFFGAGTRVRFEFGGSGRGGGGTPAPNQPVDPKNDPSIDKIFEKFQGIKIIDSE